LFGELNQESPFPTAIRSVRTPAPGFPAYPSGRISVSAHTITHPANENFRMTAEIAVAVHAFGNPADVKIS